ncbi:MAG TPA: 50S ribosomal protein L15 [Nautiliaceae bacterium]|nr:50S ribosomal protein L15 [Nautiliaceae bacterium]
MVVRKHKKKVVKKRGSRTHGYGAGKKHRGAGHRGGRGNAGWGGKYKDTKQPSLIKELGLNYIPKKYRKPMRPPIQTEYKGVNIDYLENNYLTLKEKGLIKEENEFSVVDLKELGFNKLLARGFPKRKWKIITKFVSEKAKEKIESIGGEVITN